MGSRSDIHGLVDAVPDQELDAVRAVLNAVRAKDGFESLSEDDLERLRASVRRGLGDESSRRAARELTQMAQKDRLGYE
jgi:UDP:flavonoid glycosyltransferase YjiC (YdhE family)